MNTFIQGQNPSNGRTPLQVDAEGRLIISNGLSLPTYDSFNITYFGTTNNIQTVAYSLDGAVVGTLTLAYVGGVPSTNNATISTGVLS